MKRKKCRTRSGRKPGKSQDLSAEKTNLMQEMVETAQAIIAENAVLRSENERLKRHLALAEGQIMRMKEKK